MKTTSYMSILTNYRFLNIFLAIFLYSCSKDKEISPDMPYTPSPYKYQTVDDSRIDEVNKNEELKKKYPKINQLCNDQLFKIFPPTQNKWISALAGIVHADIFLGYTYNYSSSQETRCVDFLKKLDVLDTIDLSGRDLDQTNIDLVGELVNANSINLRNNNIENVLRINIDLNKNSKLQSINLSNNPLTSLEGLHNLNNLQEIVIENNTILNGHDQIRELVSLDTIKSNSENTLLSEDFYNSFFMRITQRPNTLLDMNGFRINPPRTHFLTNTLYNLDLVDANGRTMLQNQELEEIRVQEPIQEAIQEPIREQQNENRELMENIENNERERLDFNNTLIRSYVSQGKFQQATWYFQKYLHINDTIITQTEKDTYSRNIERLQNILQNILNGNNFFAVNPIPETNGQKYEVIFERNYANNQRISAIFTIHNPQNGINAKAIYAAYQLDNLLNLHVTPLSVMRSLPIGGKDILGNLQVKVDSIPLDKNNLALENEEINAINSLNYIIGNPVQLDINNLFNLQIEGLQQILFNNYAKAFSIEHAGRKNAENRFFNVQNFGEQNIIFDGTPDGLLNCSIDTFLQHSSEFFPNHIPLRMKNKIQTLNFDQQILPLLQDAILINNGTETIKRNIKTRFEFIKSVLRNN